MAMYASGSACFLSCLRHLNLQQASLSAAASAQTGSDEQGVAAGPATKMSTVPAVSFQISGPVVA